MLVTKILGLSAKKWSCLLLQYFDCSFSTRSFFVYFPFLGSYGTLQLFRLCWATIHWLLIMILITPSYCELSNFYYSAPVGVRSIVINPSVCLSASVSLEPLDRSARNFVCRSPVAVARSSSGGLSTRNAWDADRSADLILRESITVDRNLKVPHTPLIGIDFCRQTPFCRYDEYRTVDVVTMATTTN